MNAAVADEIPADLEFIKSYKIVNAVENVTCRQSAVYNEDGKYSVALIDYGAKRNIIRELVKRGCKVTVMPAFTAAEDILKLNPDGVMLSNGPGDPAENAYQINEIKKLAGNVPIFGICLGHQLLSLALGARTEKLKYGHRGVNQPVKEVNGARTYITSQNHGYAVVSDSVKKGEISFINANDGTCEGINYPDIKAFSVQFHPEACSGSARYGFFIRPFYKTLWRGNKCQA